MSRKKTFYSSVSASKLKSLVKNGRDYSKPTHKNPYGEGRTGCLCPNHLFQPFTIFYRRMAEVRFKMKKVLYILIGVALLLSCGGKKKAD